MFARQLVAEAGAEVARLRTQDGLGVTEKPSAGIVTTGDLAADNLIAARIRDRFPAHSIVSEETWDGWRDGLFDGPAWIVDPLDGTANYAAGHPYFSVSAAYAEDGRVLAGAVCAPEFDQLYSGIRGGGARLNGTALSASGCQHLEAALVGTGVPHDRSDLAGTMQRLERLLTACRDIRRAGSPALDICWVASGWLDAHCESLAPWDVAAGRLIATEAGARVGNLAPEPYPFPEDLCGHEILVATPGIYDQLADLLA